MTNQELFESIQASRTEKKIVSFCKKLIKKCTFSSGADAQNLCELAYWLYIYGYTDDVLLICEITHDIEFPGKGGFNVWDFILFIWGLEAHILKERAQIEKANDRIKKMDELWALSAKSAEQEAMRRNSITISDCAYEEKIADATSASSADRWRFLSLFGLIGYGVTGLFPCLQKEKASVEKLAEEYIERLKQIR